MMPDPDHAEVLLGYCAKQIWTPTPEWDGSWSAHIIEVASVSDCLSERAPNWIEKWDFNRSSFWNDEASALALIPAESAPNFRLYCYRVVPILFSGGPPKVVLASDLFTNTLPDLPASQDDSLYQSLGFDVVESSPIGFGCSPLSCNEMAKEIPVNRYCLIDDMETALATGKRFGVEQPEPGPYVVIEVLRRSHTLPDGLGMFDSGHTDTTSRRKEILKTAASKVR